VEDEDRGMESPQRVRGAARAGPPPVLSEVTSPSVRSRIRVGRASTGERKRRRAVTEPRRPAGPRRAAEPGRATFAAPVVEDEVTEWFGTTGESPPAGLPRGVEAAPPAGSLPLPEPPATAARSPSEPGLALPALVVLVALVVGSLAALVVRHVTGSPGNSAASAAAARQEAARDQAAAWIAQQVSRDVIVSCDPVMCHALTAYGFPARGLLVLGPTSPDPVTAGVVVETATVRGLFGSSLATAWAPAVLASFGSGPARITIRVIAYQTALSADLAARKAAGAALLKAQWITVPPPAAGQLAAGLVDRRLLLLLRDLSRHQPVTLVQFGNTGPGASAGVPLRFVDLAEDNPAARQSAAAYVRSLRAYLSTVNASFRPATMTTVVLADGRPVLRVEVSAPSPLGVTGGQGSP
jgi:hypothetical protein